MFEVYTDEFRNAVGKIAKVSDGKAIIPSVQNVMITVVDGACRMRASNLVQYAEIIIPATGEESKFVLSDTKSLLRAIKFFKGDKIAFSLDDTGKIKIVCGDKKAEQMTMPAEEFVQFPDLKDETTYVYNVKKLKNRFDKTNYAVSNIDAKPIFTGIHFNGCDMVGVDGYRLAVNKDDNLEVTTPFTVPTNAIKFSADILSGEINISVDKKYVKFSDGNNYVMSRLLDGEFLSYKQAIGNPDIEMEINSKSFLEGLKYLKVFVTDKYKCPVRWQGDRISIANATGKYESKVDVKGEMDFEIGFNVDYMIDGIGQFESDNITIKLANPTSPMLLTQFEDDLALVLPVRLKQEEAA